MVSEIQNRNASATGKFPAFDWPTSNAKTFFSKDFWPVAWFSAIGLMVSLGLAFVSVGTGLDLTVGSVPIDTTVQAVQAASTGN